MSKVDYKQKYLEIRDQWITSLDAVWRDGYAQGYKEAQVDAQMQQANQMAQMMGGPGQIPQEQGEEPQMSPMDQAGEMADESAVDQGVSELEAGIQELEELLSKSEGAEKAHYQSLLNNLNGSLHKILQAKENTNLRKSMNDIKSFNKKAEKFSTSFKQNATQLQKKTVSEQKKIVNNIMQKWEEEEKKAASDILKAINSED